MFKFGKSKGQWHNLRKKEPRNEDSKWATRCIGIAIGFTVCKLLNIGFADWKEWYEITVFSFGLILLHHKFFERN